MAPMNTVRIPQNIGPPTKTCIVFTLEWSCLLLALDPLLLLSVNKNDRSKQEQIILCNAVYGLLYLWMSPRDRKKVPIVSQF